MRVTTNYFQTGRTMALAVATFLLFFAVAERSAALDDIFKLSQSTGTAYDMTGATQVYGRSSAVASSLINIGFTFKFDGSNYTTFSVNTSGAMSLGVVTQRYYYPYYYPNYPTTTSSYYLGDKLPFLAVYWMYVGYPLTTGGVYYKLVGSAPNRVLVVEWRDVFMQGSNSSTAYSGGTFQARLYEGSNKIEYYYDRMTNGTSYYASIGMVSTNTRWLNIWGNNISQYYIYPSGGYYSYRYPSSYPMTNRTLFSFNPCEDTVAIVGDALQGGTSSMKPGDVLFDNIGVQRGSSGTFTPFSIGNPSNGCDDITYTASFTGAAAGDYSMKSGKVVKGAVLSPQINFTPQATGDRTATMTLSLSNGKKFTYTLNGEGLTRINWLGNVSEGGVSGMRNNEVLLSDIDVDRNTSRALQPFTIENFNLDPTQKGAVVTYTLDDPLDEYSLLVPGGTVTGSSVLQTGTISLGAGASSTPVITFMPHTGGTEYGTGYQQALLRVVADGETRVYTLNGFSVAPALTMEIDGINVAQSDRNFFRSVVTCVGEEATNLKLTLTNTNRVNVSINQLDIYEVDSRVQQGAPKYPQRVDASGKPVRSNDYILSESPGVAPLRDNSRPVFPIVIPPGGTRTYYLTYVAQRPGKRYARAFFSTDAVNFYGPDLRNFIGDRQGGENVEGLMTLEYYGSGLGSSLAGLPSGGLDGLSLVFDPVKVGESGEAETTLYNSGECDLRVSVDQARLSAGDVSDFELLEVLGAATRVGQDYVIAPGAMATIKARFTPSRSGSRRATLMMATNDSTLGGGITAARGVHYLNLYGVGKADLRTGDVVLAPAVIDGPGSEGIVRIENTSTEVIELNTASLQGADVGEISPNPAMPWPALPVKMLPGDVLEFSVVLNPASGSQPSVRMAELLFTYGGDQVRASIQGLAGTRLLSATPSSLFDGLEVPVGTVVRRVTVLTNLGTLPVKLKDVRIEGPGAADYAVQLSNRRVIDAGGFEILEVVYSPTAPGNPGATLVFENTGTTGPVSVALNGSAPGNTQGEGIDPSRTIRSTEGGASRATAGSAELGIMTVSPDPLRQGSNVEFNLPAEGEAQLALYGLNGTLVTMLHQGVLGAGLQRVQIKGTLPTGTYLLYLKQGTEVVTRSVRVVN